MKQQEGFLPDQYNLMYADKILDDHKTFLDYNITDENTLKFALPSQGSIHLYAVAATLAQSSRERPLLY